MAQISDNLREGPDRACLDDCQRAVAALARAPTEIERVTAVLFSMWQRSLTGRGGRDDRWAKFERCFGVSRTDPFTLQWSQIIRDTYLAAGRVLSSPRCLISRMTEPMFVNNPEVWGYSPCPPGYQAAAGYDYEIQLGRAFLDDTSRVFDACVQRCGLFHFRDRELLRVTTLIHEAIHWVNGPGHDQRLGRQFSPNSYELFILDTVCSFPPQVIEALRAPAPPPVPDVRLQPPATLAPPQPRYLVTPPEPPRPLRPR